MVVVTESSTYLIYDRHLVRVPGQYAAVLRRDGESIPLIRRPTPKVGEPMVLYVRVREDGVTTTRTTTPVKEIKP